MTYNTLAQQVKDKALIDRIDACGYQESWNNPGLQGTAFAQAVRNLMVLPSSALAWPVCIATEAAYAYAVASGKPDPGGDATVITDNDILAAVQANWPESWPPLGMPAPPPATI